ncbi:MAG: hypothetical protein QOE28_3030, partial [Solirubrobacteraceae bacterium]|nr:hypothetical protein [Solirubrobacteraceae bacterium]
MRRSRRLAPLVVVVAAGAAALGAVPAAG